MGRAWPLGRRGRLVARGGRPRLYRLVALFGAAARAGRGGRARGAARAVARRPAGGWRLAARPRPASAGLQARLWGMAALPRGPRLRQQPAGGAPAELVRPALPGDRRHPGRLLGAAPAGPVASAVGLRLYGGLR